MPWSEIVEHGVVPCDIRACGREARWAYVGESGDLYLCAEHYRPLEQERPLSEYERTKQYWGEQQ